MSDLRVRKALRSLSALPSPMPVSRDAIVEECAKVAESWNRSDLPDFQYVAGRIASDIRALAEIPMPVRGVITGERVKEIALKEANSWADRVHLSPGLDRDQLVKGQAYSIRLDLETAQQRFADAGYAIVLRGSP